MRAEVRPRALKRMAELVDARIEGGPVDPWPTQQDR